MSAPIISPSILAADFSRLGEEIGAVSNADWIHVDIMDGHFVPNLSFGPDITATVDGLTDRILDVHLMIEDPARWVETYAKAGADHLIFHVEAVEGQEAAVELAEKIRSLGVGAGFSIKPGTPIEPWLDKLHHFDLVLVMSVEPGFGGQEFMPEMLEKVRALRAAIDKQGLETLVEIDGGISAATIAESAAAGCDAFVAGSAIYSQADKEAAVEELRALAAQARDGR
ncbi:ribulose-phosphate 3-epimerase [Corynebacterium flavescens]|uniref:Ribulose-phosphate 3-epimerase n=1 Tax=Corynebacterium flavescens TaxID=28028 RepID=A0A1L7CM38_CORFL|nr:MULTISPECIES: ribulose-phosphate 3-epimerase [Corynebacterium]APT86913.1 ribulose-phosphate 3-epimerase [Corynebacterium flavescens]KAA8722105.1 ribulose-phosphate 3-epimerase [Corynebacterium flavescens]MDN6100013.1 ribulose-phosphate 3-epimerase [Corynebacterium flavescens]MDN6199532.1 ribulose-phosphate 3-epimerase [Corynebacterium flavescens]MDN6227524.1 ribulose-phosphate 3-epimerase [Corynebacterium flavescens]